MQVHYIIDEDRMEITVDKRLDVETSPKLEKTLKNLMDDKMKTVIFDFKNLEYLSSDGLRVLQLSLNKPRWLRRKVIIRHPSKEIYDLLCTVGLDKKMEIRDIRDEKN